MSTLEATRKCFLCDFPIPIGKYTCPSCRNTSGNFGSSQVYDDEIVLLSEAEDEKDVYLSTGLEGIDRLFGSTDGKNALGIQSKSTNLIGGAPGAGKTTLELQVLENILVSHPDRLGVIVATEQRPSDLKRLGKRLNMGAMNRVRVVKAMGGMRSSLYDALRKYRPIVTVVDSLNDLVGKDLELAVKVCQQIKELIVSVDTGPGLIISHVNKDFDIAGSQDLQHAVDGTFILDVDEVTQEREFCSLKNRNAPAPRSIRMAMMQEGLVEIEEEDHEDKR